MTRTFVDVHVLQTVPPSNINRDDTGSPKTAYYGGVRRARVSSQAWKRATRTAFEDHIDRASLGVRTKRVVDLIAERISQLDAGLESSAADHAGSVLKAAGITLEKPRTKAKKTKDAEPETETEPFEQSQYLLFLSRSQVDQLATLAVQASADKATINKKAAKAAADTSHSIDVALFGRMVADAADLNVDAAAQVAHAISVHAVDNEFDYFTAVDDKAPEDNAGAGMIGTIEFNSSTLYRYATVNLAGLRHNLGDDNATAAAVTAFVRAFVTSMPTGKQTTFAHRTLPDAVVVQVRSGQPVNLVGAFEDAVQAGSGASRVQLASERLVRHGQDLDAAYDAQVLATFVVHVGDATSSLAALGDVVSMDQLIDGLGVAVTDRLRSTA